MTPAELIRRGMSQLKKKESHSEVKVFVNKTLEISTIIRRAFSWCCDLIPNSTVTSVELYCMKGGMRKVCLLFVSYDDNFLC